MAEMGGWVAPPPKPGHRNRWICFRPHILMDRYSYTIPAPQPRACGTFGGWLLCQIWWHGPQARRDWLVSMGFIDAEREGDEIFWRWRFWRSQMRAELQRLDRQTWERKRRDAIERWGEGAG